MTHEEGLYISLDDALKKTGSAPFFTRDKNGNFVKSGTVSGGIATFSSARANARRDRERKRREQARAKEQERLKEEKR